VIVNMLVNYRECTTRSAREAVNADGQIVCRVMMNAFIEVSEHHYGFSRYSRRRDPRGTRVDRPLTNPIAVRFSAGRACSTK
jgi:hypothetical protein